MKAREYRRKLKLVEGWNDHANQARHKYYQDSMFWRQEAAAHGSQSAKDEIQKELDESKTLNGFFRKVYSDHVDYSTKSVLDFLEMQSPCAEDKVGEVFMPIISMFNPLDSETP
jgi:hypothetical protein